MDSLITAAARALAASLRAWLSPSQFEQFDAEGHFDVIGSATGRKYRIQYGTSMNVSSMIQVASKWADALCPKVALSLAT